MNSLAPGRCGSNLKTVTFKFISRIDILIISCEIALRWMPQDLIDEKSKLVQVMAWCRQAPSHCLSLCWPRSMWTYGITKPQWVNSLRSDNAHMHQWHHCMRLSAQMVPSHYLNQCWLIVNWTQKINICEICFKIHNFFFDSLRPSEAHMHQWTNHYLN